MTGCYRVSDVYDEAAINEIASGQVCQGVGFVANFIQGRWGHAARVIAAEEGIKFVLLECSDTQQVIAFIEHLLAERVQS